MMCIKGLTRFALGTEDREMLSLTPRIPLTIGNAETAGSLHDSQLDDDEPGSDIGDTEVARTEVGVVEDSYQSGTMAEEGHEPLDVEVGLTGGAEEHGSIRCDTTNAWNSFPNMATGIVDPSNTPIYPYTVRNFQLRRRYRDIFLPRSIPRVVTLEAKSASTYRLVCL
jgi:hypothetical protein